MVTERKVNFNDNIQIVYYETYETYEKVNYEFTKNEKINKVNIMKCIKKFFVNVKIFCKSKNFL